jgi:hypothetical protein
MSDQANNLRQLVRAQRQWRELLGQPVLKPMTQEGQAKDKEVRQEDRTETSLAGLALFVTRTLGWARAWHMRKAGGKRGDPS